jgi:hypothetical protein
MLLLLCKRHRNDHHRNGKNEQTECFPVFQYLYTLLLYMPDYKNETAGIKQLMPWSELIKEKCSGMMDTENVVVTPRPNKMCRSFHCHTSGTTQSCNSRGYHPGDSRTD